MIWAAYTFGVVYALWLFYLAIMHLARAREASTLSRPALYLGYPLFLIGYLLDVFVQVAIASVVFLDPPRDWTLTGRLKRYIAGPEGWREKVAIWMCSHLLNAFDPDGRHC
jgi:hypothetical protein